MIIGINSRPSAQNATGFKNIIYRNLFPYNTRPQINSFEFHNEDYNPNNRSNLLDQIENFH